MLVLSRRESERIKVGDSIVVTVVRVTGDRVRLGIEAPVGRIGTAERIGGWIAATEFSDDDSFAQIGVTAGRYQHLRPQEAMSSLPSTRESPHPCQLLSTTQAFRRRTKKPLQEIGHFTKRGSRYRKTVLTQESTPLRGLRAIA